VLTSFAPSSYTHWGLTGPQALLLSQAQKQNDSMDLTPNGDYQTNCATNVAHSSSMFALWKDYVYSQSWRKSVAYFFGAPSAIRKVSIVGFVLQWREEKLIDAHTISQVPSETVMHMLLFLFLLLFLLPSSSSACPWQRLRQRKFVYGAQSVCMCVYVDLSVYVPFSTQLNSYSTNTLTHTHKLYTLSFE